MRKGWDKNILFRLKKYDFLPISDRETYFCVDEIIYNQIYQDRLYNFAIARDLQCIFFPVLKPVLPY